MWQTAAGQAAAELTAVQQRLERQTADIEACRAQVPICHVTSCHPHFRPCTHTVCMTLPSIGRAASTHVCTQQCCLCVRLQNIDLAVQARDAETRRQREVMDHSDTIRKLNAAEAAAESAEKAASDARAAAESATAAQVRDGTVATLLPYTHNP